MSTVSIFNSEMSVYNTIISNIIINLDLKDNLNASLVCKKLHELCVPMFKIQLIENERCHLSNNMRPFLTLTKETVEYWCPILRKGKAQSELFAIPELELFVKTLYGHTRPEQYKVRVAGIFDGRKLPCISEKLENIKSDKSTFGITEDYYLNQKKENSFLNFLQLTKKRDQLAKIFHDLARENHAAAQLYCNQIRDVDFLNLMGIQREIQHSFASPGDECLDGGDEFLQDTNYVDSGLKQELQRIQLLGEECAIFDIIRRDFLVENLSDDLVMFSLVDDETLFTVADDVCFFSQRLFNFSVQEDKLIPEGNNSCFPVNGKLIELAIQPSNEELLLVTNENIWEESVYNPKQHAPLALS